MNKSDLSKMFDFGREYVLLSVFLITFIFTFHVLISVEKLFITYLPVLFVITLFIFFMFCDNINFYMT